MRPAAAHLAAVATIICAPALAGDLVVSVAGVVFGDGRVGCALHDRAETFPAGSALRTLWRRAEPGGVICRFVDLPSGRYAVSVFHDANGNGRLDTNLIGIPTEAWGVTNNVRPAMRGPTFGEAQVEVGPRAVPVDVRLRR
jgi:uncharacterized protein (DUF2141 family)